jgi:septum formation inhibitor MinC
MTEEAKPIQVPAIGFSTTINVDGNRQIVFQGYFEQDESDDTVNARLDRIMRLADRQRGIYEIPLLKEERQKLRDDVAQAEQDIAEADANFQKQQAQLDVQILEMHGQREEALKEGYAAHAKRGGQGPYKPQGKTEANLRLVETQIENFKKAKETNAAERQQFLDNIQVAISRRQARLLVLDEKIGDLEKVAS